MRRVLIVLVCLVVVVGVAGFLFVRSVGMFAGAPVYTTERGALDGYDPVAFFVEGRPVAGEDAHSMQWRGSRWKFSSAQNLERFRRDPEAFAPQYGGYCAYGMANGYTARTDPDTWTIVDGRLYLNFDADVKAQWQAERAPMIERADEHWLESRPARNLAAMQ